MTHFINFDSCKHVILLTMLSKLLIISSILCLSKGIEINDLAQIFGDKDCIEASFVTLKNDVKNTVLEKPTGTTVKDIINTTKTATEKNPTGLLNELAQLNQITTEYELISEEGPAHKKHFTVELRLGNEVYKGSGSSLKKAKTEAAIAALESTVYKHPPVKIQDEPIILTPTVVLNNVAMKLGIPIKYDLLTGKEEATDVTNYESHTNLEAYGKPKKSYMDKLNSSKPYLRVPVEDAQISGPFHVKVKVDDLEFVGFGHTIQSAKHDAAVRALKAMQKEALFKDNVCAQDESVDLCKQKKEGLKSPISRIYEAGQLHKIPAEFNVVEESGKAHNKLFVTECTLGEFVTRGEGRSKKDSKRSAAELMLDNLNKLPETYNANAIASNMGGKKKKRKKKSNIIRGNEKQLSAEVAGMITSFFSSDDVKKTSDVKKTDDNAKKTDFRPDKSTNKNKLLELGNLLNVEIQFNDLGTDGGNHFTLLSLNVNPLHICLGKAATQKESHENASLNGLKFLLKTGLVDAKQWETIYDKDDDYFNDLDFAKEEAGIPDVFEETD